MYNNSNISPHLNVMSHTWAPFCFALSMSDLAWQKLSSLFEVEVIWTSPTIGLSDCIDFEAILESKCLTSRNLSEL